MNESAFTGPPEPLPSAFDVPPEEPLPVIAAPSRGSIFGVVAPILLGPAVETKEGHLSIIDRRELVNATVSLDSFNEMLPCLDKQAAAAPIRYARWILIDFIGKASIQLMYDELLRLGCDIVGIVSITGDVCCAICRRTIVKRPLLIHGIVGIQAH